MDLYTAHEAADEVGVSVNTIYSWVRRNHLTHAGKRGHQKLFKLSDVFECEKARHTRDTDTRNAGTLTARSSA